MPSATQLVVDIVRGEERIKAILTVEPKNDPSNGEIAVGLKIEPMGGDPFCIDFAYHTGRVAFNTVFSSLEQAVQSAVRIQREKAQQELAERQRKVNATQVVNTTEGDNA